MNSKLFLTLAAASMLFVSTSGTAWARGHGGKGNAMGPDLEKVAAELGLDSSTVASMKEIRREARDAIMEIKFEVKKLKVAMHDSLDVEQPNESEIMRMVEDMGKLEIEIHKTRVKAMLKARAYLTPEQRIKFKAMKKDARRKNGKRHKGRADF
jgi:Spy/CpxP family protein refolding chaperone